MHFESTPKLPWVLANQAHPPRYEKVLASLLAGNVVVRDEQPHYNNTYKVFRVNGLNPQTYQVFNN